MSCNFNISTCKNCPRYNGCLLQIIYSNTINLGTIVSSLSSNQKIILDKLNEITDVPLSSVSQNNETSQQIETLSHELNDLKNDLSILDVKVDDVINSNNEYELLEDKE